MIFAVIRRRGQPWDSSKPIEEQPAWLEHAEFMDRHHEAGAIPFAGPLGDERKVLLIVRADSRGDVERLFAADVWTEMGLLETESVEAWTLRLGSLGQTSSTRRP